MDLRRRNVRQTVELEARMVLEAKQLRIQANLLPPGPLRSEILRRARVAEVSSHLNDWMRSPLLRPPK